MPSAAGFFLLSGNTPGSVSFTSSAGVFNSDGELVRVLWQAELDHEDEAAPENAWDGTLEDGTVAPTGTYTIKLIRHRVQYDWEGAIGNTSETVDTVRGHAYGSQVHGMVVNSDNRIWFTTVYDERIQTVRTMLTTAIQASDEAVIPQTFRNALIAARPICSDGTLVYVGLQAGAAESGVVGIICADRAYKTFSSGTTVGTVSYLGLRTDGSFAAIIDGLAVQQSGDFIFVARPNLSTGTVDVYNKSTGASASSFTGLADPHELACNPVTPTQLWIAHSSNGDTSTNVIVKCSVNGSGVISTTGTTISVQDAQALAVSPDGTMLLVADGGSSQQVKAYNTSDGTVKSAWGNSGTLGTLGGYASSPDVTDSKFMFYAPDDMGSSGPQAYIAFEPDGRFWLGDAGNCRNLRFSSGNSPAVVDRFSYIPGFYSVGVCKGDPTRAFANFLEFELDYDIELGPNNGSWTLVRNWMENLPTTARSPAFNAMKFVGTYTNGRTYACCDLPGVALRRIFELTSTGLRSTDTNIQPVFIWVDNNFNLYSITSSQSGQVCTISKNAFLGFDGSNNPSWAVMDGVPGSNTALDGSGVTVFTSETLPALFPRTKGGDNNTFQPMMGPTANNIIPFFDRNGADGYGLVSNHFGGCDATTGQVKFNLQPCAPTRTGGTGLAMLMYPPPSHFGYNITNAGGPLLYEPGQSDIFTNYNGEEWGNNQTNMWIHYHDSGLAIGTFGAAAPYFGADSLRNPDLLEGDNIPASDPYSFRGMAALAGNCRWGGLAFHGGNYYIFQNDEWYHGGIHRWKISNLASIQLTETTVAWDENDYVAETDPTNMLEGLTNDAVLVNGVAGWTRNQADETVSFLFKAYSGGINCNPRTPDVCVEMSFLPDATLRKVSRELTRSGSGDWTVEGDIFIYPGELQPGGNPNIGGLIYIELLDSTGKVLIRWFAYQDSEGQNAGTILVNNEELFPVPAQSHKYSSTYFGYIRPFSIRSNIAGGEMTLTYDTHSLAVPVFEVGADISDIDSIRFTNDYDVVRISGQPKICLTRLRFF